MKPSLIDILKRCGATEIKISIVNDPELKAPFRVFFKVGDLRCAVPTTRHPELPIAFSEDSLKAFAVIMNTPPGMILQDMLVALFQLFRVTSDGRTVYEHLADLNAPIHSFLFGEPNQADQLGAA